MDNPDLNRQAGGSSEPVAQSWWKEFLDFLWDGGYRSTIVLAITIGAIVLTIGNKNFCPVVPADNPKAAPSLSQPKSQASAEATQANSDAKATDSAQTAATPEPTVVILQSNPICAKYFELTFMVVGGYLGLSLPSSKRSAISEGVSGHSGAKD